MKGTTGDENEPSSRRAGREAYATAMFAEDSRGRILRATTGVISRTGVRECTVQQILDEAGLSRRTFYKLFSNIEEALDAVFEVSTSLVRTQIEEAVAEATTPVERIMNAIDAYLNLQVAGGALIVALQTESLRPESLLWRRREELMLIFVKLFSGNIEAATGRRYDPLVYRSLILLVEGLVHFLQEDGPVTAEDMAHVRSVAAPLITRALGLPGADEMSLPAPPEGEP